MSKGTPVWVDQGAYNNDTFWEQLDDGVPWTRAKKILLIIPVIMCVIGCRRVAALSAARYSKHHAGLRGCVCAAVS